MPNDDTPVECENGHRSTLAEAHIFGLKYRCPECREPVSRV